MREPKNWSADGKREEFGEGPWVDEPDRVEFEAHGLPCLILRNPLGFLCGYAAVPPGHPLHGLHYDDAGVRSLYVHGGLTFAGQCDGEICHTPKPGERGDVHWFGFDCAHGGDFMPHMNTWLNRDELARFCKLDRYRDLAYVRAECEQLAEQLAAADKENSDGVAQVATSEADPTRPE